MLLKLYCGKVGISKLVSTLKAEDNKCFEHNCAFIYFTVLVKLMSMTKQYQSFERGLNSV